MFVRFSKSSNRRRAARISLAVILYLVLTGDGSLILCAADNGHLAYEIGTTLCPCFPETPKCADSVVLRTEQATYADASFHSACSDKDISFGLMHARSLSDNPTAFLRFNFSPTVHIALLPSDFDDSSKWENGPPFLLSSGQSLLALRSVVLLI